MVFLFVPITLFFTATTCFCKNKVVGSNPTVPQETYFLPLKIRYGFLLTNKSYHPVANVGLKVFAPVRQTGTQRCEKI
jgi:hypothetical protein